jgi:uncharacterized protein YecE (DUF72 family)
MATAWIGTSGFRYRHWRGVFYPRELPTRERLSYYAARFPTVELDTTFYGLPRRDTVRGWLDAVPGDFRFAAKLSRYGTHLKHHARREPLRITRDPRVFLCLPNAQALQRHPLRHHHRDAHPEARAPHAL